MERKLSKAEQCRNMMYRRSMIADLNLFTIQDSLTDIKDRFDSMRAAVDIFRDENVAILGVIKSINDKYEELFDKNGKLDRWHKEKEIREFDKMVAGLPEKYWVE